MILKIDLLLNLIFDKMVYMDKVFFGDQLHRKMPDD